MTRAPRRLRAAIAAIAALAVLAMACAPGTPPLRRGRPTGREARSSSTSPGPGPFAISASGSGQIELVGVRLARASPHQAAPGVVVRDGTAEIEVARGQVLDFRLEPDEGVSVESVSVGGEDAAGRLGADGVLTLAAEDPGRAGGRVRPCGPRRRLRRGRRAPGAGVARTGDLPWVGAGALALAALCAYGAARCASRSDAGGKAKVQPRESA